MKIPPNTLRIGIAAAIIVGTIGWLAYSGYGANKSYYVTIAELGGMGDKAYHSQLRVEGFVQPGSIEQNGTHVTFVMNEFESHSPKAASGRLLTVNYKGSEPPPDTFKDNSQALACFTPLFCRPSAPASMLLRSRGKPRPCPNPAQRPPPVRTHRRLPRTHPIRLPPLTLPQTDRMNVPASQAARSMFCARLDQVSKLFGSFAALRQVSVDLEPGRCYVLVGENGAGKSTLLRILAGLLRPSFGRVRVFGELSPDSQNAGGVETGGFEPHDARERIGYMSHAPMLYDELTAQENLRYFGSLYPGRDCLTPAEALRQVGLDSELNRTLGQYSQGMRQRTSLARVLLPVPELLLLDEPFSNMDVESARQMVELLAGFRQSNRTIVLTTHQRDLAAPIADWVLTLHAGRVASFEPGNPTL
jgi:ABC-type multidrug transport system ATPase subunit/cytochrome c-type biogenesis protein CcmE